MLRPPINYIETLLLAGRSVLQVKGRGLYSISLVAMGLAIAEVALMFVPKVKALSRVYELFHFFVESISPKLGVLFGTSVAAQAIFNAALIWLASFAAIASFTRNSDGTSVWRIIATDSCGRMAEGSGQHTFCTATKWLLTLFGGPFLIVWALWHRRRAMAKTVSVGYVTINPSVLVTYLKHLAIVVAMILSGLLYWTGLTKEGSDEHAASVHYADLAKS